MSERERERERTTKRSTISIAFQQCIDEEDGITTDFKICKSRSLFKNQLQKLKLPSNAHNLVNSTWYWTIPPPKEVEFKELSNNAQN